MGIQGDWSSWRVKGGALAGSRGRALRGGSGATPLITQYKLSFIDLFYISAVKEIKNQLPYNNFGAII